MPFVDKSGKSYPNPNSLDIVEYWKKISLVFSEYRSHRKTKLDSSDSVVQRKHLVVTGVIHIRKESNKLDESELFGLDDSSYEIYQNGSEIAEKFRKLAPKILELNPKEVKELGISKQTLWNVKQKIKYNQLKKISNKIKSKLIVFFLVID